MKKLLLLAALTGAFVSYGANADPWKDESGNGKGHGHHKGGEQKREYWDGNCKVEQKWKGNGEYKEERKCPAPRYVQPAVPVYPAYPQPGVAVQPGVVIQGTAVIH